MRTVSKLRIVGWVDWSDKRPDVEKNYAAHERLVVAEIRRLNLRRGGFWRQGQTADPARANEPEHGCPLFSDGTVFRVSMRGWGAVMAKALRLPPDMVKGINMSYCKYAWYEPDEPQLITVVREVLNK